MDCHDNTFRHLNNQWTAQKVLNVYHTEEPNKHLILRDGSTLVDTNSGQVGYLLYRDSIGYKIDPVSSEEELNASKLNGLVYNFHIDDFSQAEELLDSMDARLVNIYDKGDVTAAEQNTSAVKYLADALENKPYTKSVKCVQTPYISFLILLKTDKELLLIIHFI